MPWYRIAFKTILFALVLTGCTFVSEPDIVSEEARPVVLSGIVDNSSIASLQSQPVQAADVYLYKIQNGSSLLLQQTVTDSNGQFSFADIESSVQGSGVTSDYYYEIEVLFDNHRLLAASAMQQSENISVDLQSTVFAHMVRYILGDLDSSEAALPGVATFKLLNKLTREDLFRLHSKFSDLSSSLDASPDTATFAKGMLSANEASEQMATRFSFQSRWNGLKTSKADVDQWTVYMRDIARASCGAMDGFVPLPYKLAMGVAEAAQKGKRFSVKQVIDAFNSSNENLVDLYDEQALERYQQVLSSLSSVLNRSGNSGLRFGRKDILFLISLRGLDINGLSLSSRLDPDQALMLWYLLESEGQDTRLCKPRTKMLANAMYDLMGEKSLKEPAVVEAQIYHVFGDECNDQKKSAFHAQVYVNMPGNSDKDRMHSLRVKSSDRNSLKTDTFGIAYLFLKDGDDDDQYSEELSDACVSADLPVTYTVEARMFDVDKKTRDLKSKKETLETRHWSMPRFKVSYNDRPLSKTFSSATPVGESRPLFSLPDPSLVAAELEELPPGASVKYSYRFYHENTRAVGKPLASCGQRQQTLFSTTDTLLMPDACDRSSCSVQEGVSQVNTQCHLEVNAWLLDKEQRILSKSATTHAYFCVDKDGDGHC